MILECLVFEWHISAAHAQFGGDTIPSTAYTSTLAVFYDGDYRDAVDAFRAEARSAIKTPQSRWIDSICYHTMTGECYYQMGQLPEALDQYNAALKLYLAYSNWMMSVRFSPIQPASTGARANVPWGQSMRGSRLGQFHDAYQMEQGRLDNSQVIRSGGVVQRPQVILVNVAEIVRCTTLALRRRRELMGPLCQYDSLTNQLVAALERRPGPSNNWSQAWIEVQLGAAYSAAGKTAQAISALEHAVLAAGEFDHPLTGTALLELGRLALEGGDFGSAGRFFLEATFAAANYGDAGVLEEAFRWGQLAHLLSNQQGTYSPLATAVGWAKAKNLRQLHGSLALLAAENLAVTGQAAPAAALLSEARGGNRARAMLGGAFGARLSFLSSLLAYRAGNLAAGDQALAAALAYQKTGSLWLFQILLADQFFLSGASDRQSLLVYAAVLRDPTPADWGTSPLECLSVLSNLHETSLENWFELAMKQDQGKDPAVPLEIADRARRHRFLSTLPMGGRLLSLRWILEAPKDQLSESAQLQRQDLLVRYPNYEALAQRAAKLRTSLVGRPPVAADKEALRVQTSELAEWAKIGAAQEVILREMAVRREPSEIAFPPLRKMSDVQRSLRPGTLLLTFFSTSRNVYGFLYSRERYASWRLAAPTQLKRELSGLLRELGNYEQNHELTEAELMGDDWKKSALALTSELFDKSKVDLAAKFDEVVIVPDGILWYLPFEILPVGNGNELGPLISHARVRYAPTVSLAVSGPRGRKAPANIGVVVGKLYPQNDESVARGALERLAHSVPEAVALPNVPPAPSSIYRSLFDELIVLDDVETNEQGPYDWSPAQIDRGKPGSSLSAWFALPWGGPEEIVLPGFHSAAENSMRKGLAAGNELFLSICGLMSTGARTLLISRWRPGGQTSFDLVREFVQELPHTSPAAAWQRSVQVATEGSIDPDLEPRVKRNAGKAGSASAQHPFFWAGYLVVDSGDPGESAEDPAGAATPPTLNFSKKLKPDAVPKDDAKGDEEKEVPPLPELPVERSALAEAEKAAQEPANADAEKAAGTGKKAKPKPARPPGKKKPSATAKERNAS